MFQLHLISYPDAFDDEVNVIIDILQQEDVIFHLRKPGMADGDYEDVVRSIPSAYYHKIVLHSAYYLAKEYRFAGIHLSTQKRNINLDPSYTSAKSTSCHSLDELKAIQDDYDMCFLSPIFDSISKEGYSSHYALEKVKHFLLNEKKTKVIALGGIDEQKLDSVNIMGFDGAATLGNIWGNAPNKHHDFKTRIRKMNTKVSRPYCLSIAGFDPSGGAGVLSDIKTFESLGCYGFGVNTAHTFQNADEFLGVEWCTIDTIKKQIKPLLSYDVKCVKIGLVKSFSILQELLYYVKEVFPNAFIIWDPILKASAGFAFHSDMAINNLLLSSIDLVTPNAEEYDQLTLANTRSIVSILLKGGHRADKRGIDTLYWNDQEIDIEGVEFKDKKDKHGTGCVLSSAIAAYLAKGECLPEAVKLAKHYVERFICSNEGRLGWHS